jgi:GDP-L-fucose synthase
MLKKNIRIFLAGHNGLVGRAVYKKLNFLKFKNIITVEKKKLDLRDSKKVKKYFLNKKIDIIIMAAARAGGIMANERYQKNFFFENIEIQNSLLKLSLEKKVKRVIFLGTSCIYPKFSKTPIKESYLMTGKLEKTNECYAIAKIAGIKLCEALYSLHNLDIVALMPTNIYGINDNFDKETGHVIPAMISKFIEAKEKNRKKIILWGSGKPEREFLHAEDLASAIIQVMSISKKELYIKSGKNFPLINVGSNEVITIKKLSEMIKKFVDFKGEIVFDRKFPDGTLKKNLDSRIIKNLGWKPKIRLSSGLKVVIGSRS